MTTTTTTTTTARLDFSGLLRSEVIKARGLRSVQWLLALVLALPVATAVLSVLTADTAGGTHEQVAEEALSAVTGMSWIPLMLVLLLGTIVATSEFERGAVQTTFTVAPAALFHTSPVSRLALS